MLLTEGHIKDGHGIMVLWSLLGPLPHRIHIFLAEEFGVAQMEAPVGLVEICSCLMLSGFYPPMRRHLQVSILEVSSFHTPRAAPVSPSFLMGLVWEPHERLPTHKLATCGGFQPLGKHEPRKLQVVWSQVVYERQSV